MQTVDVNVLIYAFRRQSPHHAPCLSWLEGALDSDQPLAISDPVLSGFLRITTNPRLFDPPASIGEAFGFVDVLMSSENFVRLLPGPRQWRIFSDLCNATGAQGNLVPDAYLASLAIEADCDLVTTDGDFAIFPGLRWRSPLV